MSSVFCQYKKCCVVFHNDKKIEKEENGERGGGEEREGNREVEIDRGEKRMSLVNFF